jgi:hypothetical protein
MCRTFSVFESGAFAPPPEPDVGVSVSIGLLLFLKQQVAVLSRAEVGQPGNRVEVGAWVARMHHTGLRYQPPVLKFEDGTCLVHEVVDCNGACAARHGNRAECIAPRSSLLLGGDPS